MPKKVSHLGKNEIRVIKLSRLAIEELIWETFMEIGNDRLNLEPNSDDIVFHMTFDDSMSELTFYACDFSKDEVPDFNKIDKYISQNVGTTTDSIYKRDKNTKHFKTVLIPDAET